MAQPAAGPGHRKAAAEWYALAFHKAGALENYSKNGAPQLTMEGKMNCSK